MALLMLIMIQAIYFGVSDLPFDFRSENIEVKEGKCKTNFINVYGNTDLIFLIVSSSFIISFASMNEIIINLSAAGVYKWSLSRLGVVTCICVLLYSTYMLTVGVRMIQQFLKWIYFLTFVFMGFCMFILYLPRQGTINDEFSQYIQITVSILINSFTGISCAVLARSFLFKMVPVSAASFADGARSFTARVFGLLAFFSASWVFEYRKTILPILGFFTLLLGFICLLRKRFRPSIC